MSGLCKNKIDWQLGVFTLYTNEHTKSMKPHCIFGSSSALFLSIMGWEKIQRIRILIQTLVLSQCNQLNATFLKAKLISTNLQWVVGLAQSSPGLPAPRIQLPPWEPPSENSVFRLKERLLTQCWINLAMNNQSCTYFALDLPWLGNGRQVTSSHHHCPVWNQTHVFKLSIQYVLK